MVTGLYLTPEGKVVVDYGKRKIPMPVAQYRANGYKPPHEKLTAELSREANGCIHEVRDRATVTRRALAPRV
jgi:hypothetical protein